jgi:hypothetical protein
MSEDVLIHYWLKPPRPHGPLGFGVTAFSLDDAIRIIRWNGYSFPERLDGVEVRAGITFEELTTLDHANYITTHLGPMAARGLWYPFVRLGAPDAR